ncbi:MAG: flavodoxin family protein [Muribaculum sp.]|nr:flavodoxin family protein [Muribaculum sp.]
MLKIVSSYTTLTATFIIKQALNSLGVDTERVNIGNKDVRGCISCRYCREHGRCVFNDEVNETAPKFAEADGIICGSPVYYASASGQLRSFLDRLFYSTMSTVNKTMKVGAAVISSRRAGSTTAFDEINKYFTISAMPIVSSTYWNEVHGAVAEDVEKDVEGLQTMRNLGRNMAFLIKAINAVKSEIPEQERNTFTNFIRE